MGYRCLKLSLKYYPGYECSHFVDADDQLMFEVPTIWVIVKGATPENTWWMSAHSEFLDVHGSKYSPEYKSFVFAVPKEFIEDFIILNRYPFELHRLSELLISRAVAMYPQHGQQIREWVSMCKPLYPGKEVTE